MTAVRTEEEVLFSGYETACGGQGLSGGCLSGSGEWQADKSATDSDRLEHVGSPPQPDNDECCILDILTTPLPLLLDSYDESLSVAMRHRSEKSGREKTKEEGGGSEREGKGVAVGGSGKGEDVKGEEGEGVKGEEGDGVKGEEGDGVKGEEGDGVKGEEGDGVKGEEGEGVKGEEGEGVKREDKKCEGFTCHNHVTEPLVHNTNVSYITYHQCCHAPSLLDIELSPSHSTQCLYCHPVQLCCARVHPSPSPCHPLHPSHCHPLHPSHCHHHPSQTHKCSFSHPYKPTQPTKSIPFDTPLPR